MSRGPASASTVGDFAVGHGLGKNHATVRPARELQCFLDAKALAPVVADQMVGELGGVERETPVAALQRPVLRKTQ